MIIPLLDGVDRTGLSDGRCPALPARYGGRAAIRKLDSTRSDAR